MPKFRLQNRIDTRTYTILQPTRVSNFQFGETQLRRATMRVERVRQIRSEESLVTWEREPSDGERWKTMRLESFRRQWSRSMSPAAGAVESRTPRRQYRRGVRKRERWIFHEDEFNKGVWVNGFAANDIYLFYFILFFQHTRYKIHVMFICLIFTHA